MIFYYGIRPTGANLHLGHVMALMSMFDKIKNNLKDISTIYILLAETHAENSTISFLDIRKNSDIIANKIYSLFKAYIKFNDIQSINLIDKIKFIYQNDDDVGVMHRDVTYKFLPMINLNDVASNPIFKNSDNNSVGFLIYPILQAFDVLLYSSTEEELTVFVSGDQQANVNIMKDIKNKLSLKNIIKYEVYDNVIYDFNCKAKMSKSLNNFVNFDDILLMDEYVNKHITFSRPRKNDIGKFTECPLYNNIILYFETYLNSDFSYVNLCNSAMIGCFECKHRFFNTLHKFINLYIEYQNNSNNIKHITSNDIKENYLNLISLIDTNRSKKNENS